MPQSKSRDCRFPEANDREIMSAVMRCSALLRMAPSGQQAVVANAGAQRLYHENVRVPDVSATCVLMQSTACRSMAGNSASFKSPL